MIIAKNTKIRNLNDAISLKAFKSKVRDHAVAYILHSGGVTNLRITFEKAQAMAVFDQVR